MTADAKRTLTCIGCGATAEVSPGGNVGRETEESGFTFFFLIGEEGHCRVCPSCLPTVREGVATLRRVFGARLGELHMLLVASLSEEPLSDVPHPAPTYKDMCSVAGSGKSRLDAMIERGDVIVGQHFQWNLQTSRYDRSPCCGARVGYVEKSRRVCLHPACSSVYRGEP